MIDCRRFFREPPRIRAEVKQHVDEIAQKILDAIVRAVRIFDAEQLAQKHVRLALFLIMVEPVTCFMNGQLCYRQSTLKPIFKSLTRAIARSDEAVRNGNRYGRMERHTFLTICRHGKAQEPRFTKPALLHVAAVINEVCGILLHNAQAHMRDATLTMAHMKLALTVKDEHGTRPHASFIRFLHRVGVSMD